MAKENGNLLSIKQLNKGKKFKQLTSYCAKFLKDGSPGDGIEDICDVHMYNSNGHLIIRKVVR